MIGRGVLGNPWLLKQTVELLDNNNYIDAPSLEEKIDMCIKHLNYLKEIKPDKVARLEIRNHIGWYLKGMKNSNEIKNKVYQCLTIHDIMQVLVAYKEEIKNDKD